MSLRICAMLITHVFAITTASTISVQAASRATALTLTSPDGNIVVRFSVHDTNAVKGGLFWRIDAGQKAILEDSRLGFSLKNAPALTNGFTIIKVKRNSYDNTWKPVVGECSEIRDHYNEMCVTVQDAQTPPRQLTLCFRAYDEGAAYRATFPKQKALAELTITGEETQFRLAGDHQAWITRHAQGQYNISRISKLDPKQEYERPFVMKTADGNYISIAEAGLLDFARMKISRDPNSTHAVISRLSGPATIKAPYSTPWRVVMPAANPCELLQHNYMLLNLSPPCRIRDTSWIKPGKQMRDVTITKANGKAIVDFAAVAGLDYLEIDAGWYGDERSDEADATTVTPARSRGGFTEQDLHDVIAHAKSKGIEVIVYVNRRHLERQLDVLLPLYKKWGISGLKFGFVQVGSQQWTTWLHDAIRKCADYHMVVDVHDEYRPTGIERTYPNFLTAEGIRGNETRPTPKENVDTAFLRAMCGPADFTMCWHSESLKLSWAHQMASVVVYYSPLQTLYWYDQPKQFKEDEPYFAFFRALSTVWDQKKVIQGEIGKFITVARRRRDCWFVGTMNAVEQRELDIPLSFLEPNKTYSATIYSDTDPDGATNPKSVAIKTMMVNSETVIHANMARNGGQAIHIVPNEK